ncbi:MAG: hypothetical protein AABY22_32315, partial [Nanoarchaeota archaeon]
MPNFFTGLFSNIKSYLTSAFSKKRGAASIYLPEEQQALKDLGLPQEPPKKGLEIIGLPGAAGGKPTLKVIPPKVEVPSAIPFVNYTPAPNVT